MKIALAAYEFRNRDFAFNLSQIERGLREASGKAELLVFGEAFLQGFDALNWDYAHDLALAVSTDSAIFQKLKGWTSDYGIGLALGYIEQDGNDIYSSCAIIDQGALIHNYRRISRGWKEYWHTDEHYREGDQAEGFSFRNIRMCLALCGDLWDIPQRFVTDDLLIWPVYVDFSLEEWKNEIFDYASQAALAAGQTLMVNSITKEPGSHGGAFFFQDGAVMQRLPFDEEALLIVEV